MQVSCEIVEPEFFACIRIKLHFCVKQQEIANIKLTNFACRKLFWKTIWFPQHDYVLQIIFKTQNIHLKTLEGLFKISLKMMECYV